MCASRDENSFFYPFLRINFCPLLAIEERQLSKLFRQSDGKGRSDGSFLSLAADPSLQSRARGRVFRFWVLAPCIAYLQPPELPLKFLSQLLIAGGIWGTQPLDWTVPARREEWSFEL